MSLESIVWSITWTVLALVIFLAFAVAAWENFRPGSIALFRLAWREINADMGPPEHRWLYAVRWLTIAWLVITEGDELR